MNKYRITCTLSFPKQYEKILKEKALKENRSIANTISTLVIETLNTNDKASTLEA